MGSTLEAQQKKAPKPKKQVVVRGGSYSSSESLGKAFDQTIRPEIASAQSRQGVFGKASPGAAARDVTIKVLDAFRDDEGRTGSRLAKKAAAKLVEQNRDRS